MNTAFGRAMMESINSDQPQTFQMRSGAHLWAASCGTFLNLRGEEIRLLDTIALPEKGTVLDYGCGIGRYLHHIRARHSSVHCYGIEPCDLMRGHCEEHIKPPCVFSSSYEVLPPTQYDLILLVGGGLGVLGNEESARRRLESLVNSLNPGGRIIVETIRPPGEGYQSPELTIEYREWRDGPYAWGCADQNWLATFFKTLGCAVDISSSSAMPGVSYFAVAHVD